MGDARNNGLDWQKSGWFFAGKHRCRDCGETMELMLPNSKKSTPSVIGGQGMPKFMQHGPGCRGQVWDRCEDLLNGR